MASLSEIRPAEQCVVGNPERKEKTTVRGQFTVNELSVAGPQPLALDPSRHTMTALKRLREAS